MENYTSLLIYIISFGIITLAAKQIGIYFGQVKLPLISGFLLTGIIAGPFLLGLVPQDEIEGLKFIDEMSLAFIAFAAGSELRIRAVRGQLSSIVSMLLWQTVIILGFGILAFYFLMDQIEFMSKMSPIQVFSVGLLGSSIMVARSPSSAYAVIKQLRAKGQFTNKVLGTTVLTDAVVIIVFASSVSISAALLEGGTFNAALLVFLVFEIVLDLILGFILGFILQLVMGLRSRYVKGTLILTLGYSVFYFANILKGIHLGSLPIGIFSEPLLVCMVAGFYLGNFTRFATEFTRAVEDMAPLIFVLFFTLVGAELQLDVLGQAWGIILILVSVRLIGVFFGSFIGGSFTRDPLQHRLLIGFAFITQAGVSVGLAKEIGVEFHPWGDNLTTLSIGVIVISQIIGPPLLNWTINKVGESHVRAETGEYDGVRDVLIFGLESQSIALAKQLISHEWEVKIVCLQKQVGENIPSGITVEYIEGGISLQVLRTLGMEKVEAVVTMLSDEENYQICELAFENFGVKDLIVRLNDRTYFSRFHELGALIVDPSTAIVGLLDHLVRSPVAASVLLGMEPDQDIVDFEVRNPNLKGIALRDLKLPQDTLVISVSRDGHMIVSHGYTRLSLGDTVTVVGSLESLEDVALMFEE